MSLTKYKIIDLVFLSLACILMDYIINKIPFFSIGNMIKLTSIPIILLMYIRWNYVAIIFNIIVSFSYFLTFKNIISNEEILILSLSLLSLSTCLITRFIIFKKNKKIKDGITPGLVFIIHYLIFILFESIFSYIFLKKFSFLGYLTSNAFSIIFGMIIFYIMYFQKNILVDVETQLLENNKEKIE